MEIDQILKCVDHTLLKQTAVFADVKKLLDEAERFHTASACISPTMLARAKAYKGNAVRLCTVIGFPNGCQSSQVKSFEIERAIEDGADELDAVIDLGALKEGNDRKILSDLREWKGICKDRILKVIVEACLLTEEEKSGCVKSSRRAARIISRPPRGSLRAAPRAKTSPCLPHMWGKTSGSKPQAESRRSKTRRRSSLWARPGWAPAKSYRF